jgi:hypothetical protein
MRFRRTASLTSPPGDTGAVDGDGLPRGTGLLDAVIRAASAGHHRRGKEPERRDFD